MVQGIGLLLGLRFRVYIYIYIYTGFTRAWGLGLGCRVLKGSGCRVWSLGARVWVRVQGLGPFRVQGL